MEKHIHQLFNEEILERAASLYTMDLGSLQKIGGFESYVYGYKHNNKEYILRITHSSHRSKVMVQGELDWLEYLYKNNAAVCMPVYSIHNQLVELIPIAEDNYFLTTAFEKAPGRHLKAEDVTDSLLYTWGRTIGAMHRITKNYIPKDPTIKRPHWYEDKLFEKAYEYLPEEDSFVADKLHALINKLKSLPTDVDSYGLIHTDIHTGNFFIHDKGITVFDFDDCSYQHFMSDIAISLFYCLLRPSSTDERIAFANGFLEHFLKGYRDENHLDNLWITLLPDFLKLRELLLYVVIYRSCDMTNPGPWEKNYMNNRKHLIEHDIPFLGEDIDLTRFLI